MKLLPIALLLCSSAGFSQTGLIAHKSHSGTAATYTFADPGNFGIPHSMPVSVRWLNDSAVVMKMDRWGGNREDTIYHHPVYSNTDISLDSMRKLDLFGLEFIDTAKRVRTGKEVQPEKSETVPVEKGNGKKAGAVKSVSPSPKMTEDEPAKKKKAAFWFFIIGGGTFSGVMLLSRRRKTLALR